MIAPDSALGERNRTPDSQPAFSGFVRDRDPDTSWDAAAEQTPVKVNVRQRVVLDALVRFGPQTDEEIQSHIDAMRVLDPDIPLSTEQAWRTARKALHVAGRVVDTGDRRETSHGRTSAVWAIRGDA